MPLSGRVSCHATLPRRPLRDLAGAVRRLGPRVVLRAGGGCGSLEAGVGDFTDAERPGRDDTSVPFAHLLFELGAELQQVTYVALALSEAFEVRWCRACRVLVLAAGRWAGQCGDTFLLSTTPHELERLVGIAS